MIGLRDTNKIKIKTALKVTKIAQQAVSFKARREGV